MKSIVMWFLKAGVAFLIAFALVSGVCFFYYNLPIHYDNKTGATDYLWDPNHFSSRGTEGFSMTKTDENGFVNTFPVKKDSVDILVMGSSHTEGFYVGEKDNYVYLLNEKLYNGGHNMYAYNIGTSAHTLLRCLKNMDNAINCYSPDKYIVIETNRIDFDFSALKQLDEGTMEPLSSYGSGLIYYLQKSDYLRLLYSKISNAGVGDENESSAKEESFSEEEYRDYLERALVNGKKNALKNGCELIILYSPKLTVDYNGNVIPREETQQEKVFKDLCSEYKITFIDMFYSFEEMYNETYHLPRGFTNTAVGEAHTNKYGNACIAKVLYDYVKG